MYTLILQDWTVVRGTSSSSVTQGEEGWLDLAPFQDVAVYVDCREVAAANATFALQTAASRDDSLFQTMASLTLAASGTPTILRTLMLGSSVPLGRFLRWKITGPASAWDAVFRAIVVANSPGL